MNKWVRIGLYWAVVLVSCLFIFIGNRYCMEGLTIFQPMEGVEEFEGVVTGIVAEYQADETLNGGDGAMILVVQAEIVGGERDGERVIAEQMLEGLYDIGIPPCREGDRIILNYYAADGSWSVGDYIRTGPLIILGIIFLVLILIFGRKKGVNTIISLLLTCAVIFLVFVPAVLKGINIYVASIVICIFITAMTLPLISGFTRKTVASMLGCVSGVLVAGAVGAVMSAILRLSGITDDDSIYLLFLGDQEIDLVAIIFAAIILGAVGATMDVSMSISSALCEISEKVHKPKFSELLRSGMNIGRDVMGTMANTLILAYIGSSLSITLLLCATQTSLVQLLNREMVVVEILQALAGSMGILFTIPLTALIASLLFRTKQEKELPQPQPEGAEE